MPDHKFFISTAIPYVNAQPHVGFALELVQADVLARYHRQKGEATFFLTGTDENALKNVQAAEKAGEEIKSFVDRHAAIFEKLTGALHISNDDFIRTTEERHIRGAQQLWQACAKAGDIYKKKYLGLYCVGCESFLTEKDLVDGLCPEHKTKPEKVEEENYFFKLSKYQKQLEHLIDTGNLKIVPQSRRNEILSFIREGLEDFSISRSRERAKNWGISVPDNESQKIYVWIEALSNYINALGYGTDGERFAQWWNDQNNLTHIIGKGVIRFHAVYWPAMLLSAGLTLPKEIIVHGYLTVDGEKISKSLGNIIDPFELIKKYGVDPMRYFLLREIPSGEDGDFSYAKLEERYNGDLANGLGNLAQRVITLLEQGLVGEFNYRQSFEDPAGLAAIQTAQEKYQAGFANFRLHESLAAVWELIGWANGYVNEHRPWELAKSDPDHFLKVMTTLARVLLEISRLLFPFLPATAEKISASLGWDLNKDLSGLDHEKLAIKKGEGLFPRT